MDGILQTLTALTSYIVPVMTILTFLAYIIKPTRKKIHEWIKKNIDIDRQNEEIAKLKDYFEEIQKKQTEEISKINDKLDFLIEENNKDKERMILYDKIHLCTLKNRITNMYYKYYNEEYIPSYEKENLIEHYELYKDKLLLGNGRIEEIYKVLKDKKEKVPEKK